MFNLIFKICCTVFLSVIFIVYLIDVIIHGWSGIDFYILATMTMTIVTLWVPISLPHTIVLVCLWLGLLIRYIVSNWGNWSFEVWAAWFLLSVVPASLVIDCITRYHHV